MLYIKPPRGDILLSELEECVETRIKYFILKYKEKSAIPTGSIKFEFLSIGTAYDRIGHFMLRLISLESESLRNFVAYSEANFIVERLEYLSSKEIIKLIKTTLRHVDFVCDINTNNSNCFLEIKTIFNAIKDGFKNSHMVGFSHDESCSELDFKAPFQMCVPLVAKRKLLIERGVVVVPCGKWKMFLKIFVEAHLRKEMTKNELIYEAMADQRIKDLRDTVFRHFFKSDETILKVSCSIRQLDSIKMMFPLCMRSLYNTLKLKHRLSHSARFNLSLFLKDIGIPLNDSILFWRNEYSMTKTCGGKCSHSWQKDSAKYIYSIRHMYGLEGKRANYRAPSCSVIQNAVLGPSEEGGCPFMNFDHNNLKELLDPKIINNREYVEKLLQLQSDRKFSEACHYYSVILTKAANVETHCDVAHHYSPVAYFGFLYKYLNLDER